jgi:DNA-directed RNA polymerase subunit K/omega
MDLSMWLEIQAKGPLSYRLALASDIAAYVTKTEESARALDHVVTNNTEKSDDNKKSSQLSFASTSESSSPAVKLLSSTLYDSLKAGASDIHLECTPTGLSIKYRVDGVLDLVTNVAGVEIAEQVVQTKKSAAKNKPKKQLMILDEEDDDDDDLNENYLEKFDSQLVKNYIDDFHPECLSHNYDEIIKLSNVVRNSDGIIVDPLHRTIPYLTKYERARILGQRAKQIETGAKPMVKVPENIIDGYIIAELELKEKKIPFVIKRPIPSGGCEYWNLKDLEVIAF